jgi:hypothetical protein
MAASLTVLPSKVSLKAFKNRNGHAVKADYLKAQIKQNRFWCDYGGSLMPCTDAAILKQYPTYDCFEVMEKRQDDPTYKAIGNIVPCSSTISIELDDKLAAFANVAYNSIAVDQPCLTDGPMVLISTESKKAPKQISDALATLPRSVWKQMHSKKFRYLIQLGFDGKDDPCFNPVIRKDDVTGQGYPYRVLRLILLQTNTNI